MFIRFGLSLVTGSYRPRPSLIKDTKCLCMVVRGLGNKFFHGCEVSIALWASSGDLERLCKLFGRAENVSNIPAQFLYDTALITALDVSAKNGRTPADPGEGLRMRSLGSGDFKRGQSANPLLWYLGDDVRWRAL